MTTPAAKRGLLKMQTDLLEAMNKQIEQMTFIINKRRELEDKLIRYTSGKAKLNAANSRHPEINRRIAAIETDLSKLSRFPSSEKLVSDIATLNEKKERLKATMASSAIGKGAGASEGGTRRRSHRQKHRKTRRGHRK